MHEHLHPDHAALLAVAAGFVGDTSAVSVEALGAGLINATYRVDAPQGSYVLQRINNAVFPEPERIMHNLSRLAALAGAHPELGVRLPRLIPAADGAPFVRDGDGRIWRMTEYVAPSRVLGAVRTAGQAAEVGRVLGSFHRLTAELEPGALDITLPGFHHTPGYLAALDGALEETARGARQEPAIAGALAFIDDRRALAGALETALAQGLTRPRVVHGDPKIDNLLFATEADRALCLIDLDTVQPGLIHHDIGDCLRSCCNRVGESAGGDTPVRFDLDICAGILGGYAGQMRALLGSAEVELIETAVRLIPFELALRFLTDHLQGDRYFRVRRRGENLHKARVQLALVADIERQAGAISDAVARSFDAAG